MLYYFKVEDDSDDISEISLSAYQKNLEEFIYHSQRCGYFCDKINEYVYKVTSWSAQKRKFYNTEFISDSKIELQKFRKKLLIENL